MTNIYLAYSQQITAVVSTVPTESATGERFNLISGARHAGFRSASAATSFDFIYQFSAATTINCLYLGNVRTPTSVTITISKSANGSSWTALTLDQPSARIGTINNDILALPTGDSAVYFKVNIACSSAFLRLDKLFLCQYFDFETNLHDYSPFTVRKAESKEYSIDGNYLEGKDRPRELVGLTLEFKGMTDTKLAALRSIVLSKKFSSVCLFTPPESTTAGIDLLDNQKVIYGRIKTIKAEKIYYNYNLVVLEFEEED
jgi:hypothetical protein